MARSISLVKQSRLLVPKAVEHARNTYDHESIITNTEQTLSQEDFDDLSAMGFSTTELIAVEEKFIEREAILVFSTPHDEVNAFVYWLRQSQPRPKHVEIGDKFLNHKHASVVAIYHEDALLQTSLHDMNPFLYDCMGTIRPDMIRRIGNPFPGSSTASVMMHTPYITADMKAWSGMSGWSADTNTKDISSTTKKDAKDSTQHSDSKINGGVEPLIISSRERKTFWQQIRETMKIKKRRKQSESHDIQEYKPE